jgi:glycolate oxidase FAD binding subunit
MYAAARLATQKSLGSNMTATVSARSPDLQRIADQILQMRQSSCLQIRGGGSKDFYGEAIEGELLNTSQYAGIVSYEPTELVITAKTGTLLSDIEDELAAKNQMLASEPPRFSAASTIGGVVATGLSGPRRASVGATKDFVLGVSLLNHKAQELHFGGQVMKNVAGYDVSRLLCGSLGILGVITQVSLKVLPIATGDATVTAQCSQDQALKWFNLWATKSLPIVSTMWKSDAGIMAIRLSGAPAAVAAAQLTLAADAGTTRMDDTAAPTLWANIRDQKDAFFNAPVLLRLSLASTAAATESTRPMLIEWGGSQRWLAFDSRAEAVQYLHKHQGAIKSQGGSASIFRDHHGRSQFATLDAVSLKIHRRLKAEFDPHNIFNRGRLISGL